MELISMTEFVLAQENILRKDSDYTNAEAILKCINYANFLKQPLELWMFVPCDDDGKVLEEPTKFANWTNYDYSGTDIGFEDEKICREYQRAKKNCFFKDIKYNQAKEESNYSYLEITELGQINYPTFWKGLVIEDLTQYNLSLTQTAINQITK